MTSENDAALADMSAEELRRERRRQAASLAVRCEGSPAWTAAESRIREIDATLAAKAWVRPLWCRHCEQPATLRRGLVDDPFADLVHTSTGAEGCGRGDGRVVAVTWIDPMLAAEAAKLSEEFGGRWLILVETAGFRAIQRSAVGGRGCELTARTLEELAGLMRRAEEGVGAGGAGEAA